MPSAAEDQERYSFGSAMYDSDVPWHAICQQMFLVVRPNLMFTHISSDCRACQQPYAMYADIACLIHEQWLCDGYACIASDGDGLCCCIVTLISCKRVYSSGICLFILPRLCPWSGLSGKFSACLWQLPSWLASTVEGIKSAGAICIPSASCDCVPMHTTYRGSKDAWIFDAHKDMCLCSLHCCVTIMI